MTREELFKFAETEMQKTIDGKAYKLQNAAKQIAAKVYREAFENGYQLAVEIATARRSTIKEAFCFTDNMPDPETFLKNNTAAALAATWEEYKTEKKKQQEQTADSCFGLRIGDEFVQAACIGVVTGLTPGRVHILWSDGSVGDRARSMMNTAHPTGRHYGDLSDILTALQKGPDND